MTNSVRPRTRQASNRERLLEEGMRVVHEHGFANASVRDIVQAAGVPQGSFTNHFASKEAFGLEIIERHFANTRRLMEATLRNDALAPMERLHAYIDGYEDRLKTNGPNNGCLYGNFTLDVNEGGEAIRSRMLEIFGAWRDALSYCLRAAVAAGELKPSLNCEEMAGYIVSGMQGAVLLSKVYRSVEPFERFKRVLFNSTLAP